jgi:hypothetical protein
MIFVQDDAAKIKRLIFLHGLAASLPDVPGGRQMHNQFMTVYHECVE